MLQPFDGQCPSILFEHIEVFVNFYSVNQNGVRGEVAAEQGQHLKAVRRSNGAVGVNIGVVGQRDPMREAQARHEEQRSE